MDKSQLLVDLENHLITTHLHKKVRFVSNLTLVLAPFLFLATLIVMFPHNESHSFLKIMLSTAGFLLLVFAFTFLVYSFFRHQGEEIKKSGVLASFLEDLFINSPKITYLNGFSFAQSHVSYKMVDYNTNDEVLLLESDKGEFKEVDLSDLAEDCLINNLDIKSRALSLLSSNKESHIPSKY